MPHRYSLDSLKAAPEKWVELSAQEMFSIPTATLHDLQLAGARNRFSDLVNRIPMLTRLAEEQGITEITRIEDLAPLLVPHSAYKSYAISVLEQSRFDRLTRWLGGFTTEDLSGIDASSCECIDDWIDLIDTKTKIRLVHSSGTSGKLSFLPRTEQETAAVQLPRQLRMFERFNDEAGIDPTGHERIPVIYPGFRKGAMGQQRRLDAVEKFWHRGNGTPIVTLYPGRLSADALSLGGRLSAAEARGELGRVAISPALLKRREQLLKEQATAPQRYEQFIDTLSALEGRRVYMIGSYAQFFDAALAGSKRGLSKLFAPNSLFFLGGGSKGRALPEDWRQTLANFLGCEARPSFGMSELMAAGTLCPAGYYHLQPWAVHFLLDPQTGALRPRTGTQTGRLGIFDLSPWTYWGGFLTGDEATLHWGDTKPCTCGRAGVYLDPNVRRYTEKEGGDDKITCAGAPDAHDKALDFILKSTE